MDCITAVIDCYFSLHEDAVAMLVPALHHKHHTSRQTSQVPGCWVIKFVWRKEAQEILKFSTGSKSKKSMAIPKILKEGKSCELDQDVVRWSTLHWIGHVPILGNMMMA